MKIIIDGKNEWLLRLDRGEELISVLVEFSKKRKIQSGWFSGLGACQKTVLSYYNLKAKKYEDKVFKKKLEILNFTGNIAKLKKETIIHAHGVFSDHNMSVSGGHIKELVISGTGELLLKKMAQRASRQFDITTGLNLFN